MIAGLAIHNFKCLAQIPETDGEHVRFGSLNVLIGPNGCGKSSLLQAIDFLRAFFRSSVEVYLQERSWDYHDLPNLRQSRKNIRWDLIVELDKDGRGNGACTYRYTVTLQPKRYLGVGEESLSLQTPEGTWEKLLDRKGRNCVYRNRLTGETERYLIQNLPTSVMSTLDPEADKERFPEMLRFRAWVERFRAYLIWDPKVLRNPSRGKYDEIGQSGENLATVLGRLKDQDRKAFDQLVRRLKRLFPTLSDISVSGRGWGWRTIRLHESNGGEKVFNSQQMSDGVLRLLAVTAMLYLDNIPPVITFEEPENGVHPQLVREVVQILRELTQRKPPNRCQVFFTTHSPYVLDEFYDHPDEVYCMDRPQPQAGAAITRLSENKQIHVVRETFAQSLGEAWTNGLLGATAGVRRR